jgi:mRNA interferase HicA
VKRKKLLKELAKLGAKFVRHGGKHDEYSNGTKSAMVPRHADVNENLAKDLI